MCGTCLSSLRALKQHLLKKKSTHACVRHIVIITIAIITVFVSHVLILAGHSKDLRGFSHVMLFKFLSCNTQSSSLVRPCSCLARVRDEATPDELRALADKASALCMRIAADFGPLLREMGGSSTKQGEGCSVPLPCTLSILCSGLVFNSGCMHTQPRTSTRSFVY